MKEIKKITESLEPLINKEIEKLIPKKGFPQVFYDACWEYLSSGGKRLRPALLVLACEALDGKREDAIPAAAALEIIHNFLLIHDDIEDSSELRRGKPALHIKFGVPHAVNIGDYLAFKSYQCLTERKDVWGSEKSLKILELINEMLVSTVEGQAMEIDQRDRSLEEASVEWYEKMSLKKTGYYTGGTPCAIGALIAGANGKQINALKEFGFAIGVAFQVQDDILNLTEETGKEFAGDIKEGKRTLILVHAFSKANKKDKERIRQLIGKKDVTLREKKEVIELFKKYGSTDFAKKYAEILLKRAIENINKKIPDSEGRKKLISLAEFFIKRKF